MKATRKKPTMKKWLAVLLSLCMLTASLPAAVFAQEQPVPAVPDSSGYEEEVLPEDEALLEDNVSSEAEVSAEEEALPEDNVSPEAEVPAEDEALSENDVLSETEVPAANGWPEEKVKNTEGYELWVSGIQVTKGNASDVLGEADEGATVSYDADTSTLTLNGANITGTYKLPTFSHYCGIYSNLEMLNIRLVGSNTVDVRVDDSSNQEIYGILARNPGALVNDPVGKSITISGEGSLTASGNHYGIFVQNDLTVESGTVTGKGISGIHLLFNFSGTLTVNGGTVNGEGIVNDNPNNSTFGISACNMTVKDGTVTAKGSGKYGTGISSHTDKGEITVYSGTVTAIGTASNSYGIHGHNLTVEGGEVTAEGTGYEKTALYLTRGGRLTVHDGTVTATGNGEESWGIQASDITVSGGTVTGESSGWKSVGIGTPWGSGEMIVSGGTVTGKGVRPGSIGIHADDLQINKGTITAQATEEGYYGIYAGTLQVTGGSITAQGTKAAVAAKKSCTNEEEAKATKLIQLSEGYLPANHEIYTTFGYSERKWEHWAAAAIAAADETVSFDIETETFTGAVTEITLPVEHTHNKDGHVAHKDPTCTKAGVVGGTYCTICGKGKADAEKVIPALGHRYGSWQKDSSKHWKQCSCGAKTNVGSHSFGSWTVTRKATLTQKGSKKRTCSVCGYAQTSTIPVLKLQAPAAKLQINTSSIKLTWNKISNAKGYVIYKKTGNGKLTKLATVNGASRTSYTDKKVTSGNKYSYQVRAFNGKTYSSYSKAVTTIYLASQKPTVKKMSNGIRVSYKKIRGAKGYVIYRKTAKGKWSRLTTINKANAGSFLDKKAKKGTTYQYMVKARSGSYYSAYTASAKIKR